MIFFRERRKRRREGGGRLLEKGGTILRKRNGETNPKAQRCKLTTGNICEDINTIVPQAVSRKKHVLWRENKSYVKWESCNVLIRVRMVGVEEFRVDVWWIECFRQEDGSWCSPLPMYWERERYVTDFLAESSAIFVRAFKARGQISVWDFCWESMHQRWRK